jgi:hypothetical protein
MALHRTKTRKPMSALGQKRTLQAIRAMSALPPKADIAGQQLNVRFVPKADIEKRALEHRVVVGAWRPQRVSNRTLPVKFFQ